MPDLTTADPPLGTDLLDARMTTVLRHCRDMAPDIRAAGAVMERDPDAVISLTDLPAVAVLRAAATPRRYQYQTPDLDGVTLTGTSCLEWTVVLEAISYGDPSLVLGGPGPSLSGAAVAALGSEAQCAEYFAKLAGPTWTFFALTEPNKGSAVLELETRLDRDPDGDGWLLNGAKRFVGNGARAQLGVVFCRRAPGPWGIEAVLVDTSDPGFRGELLPTVGLRGARLSHLQFDGVRVAPAQVLGLDRPPSRRGFHGAMTTLLRCRPTIAGMALGVGDAACDYAAQQRPHMPAGQRTRLDAMRHRLGAVRRLVHAVAADIDAGVVNAHRVGAVKMRAGHLGAEATILAADLLGPGSLLEHPWLAKASRDVRGFEYMEGTTNVHRQSIFQGLLKGTFFPGQPA
ncbi:acyl-CoA dehydrogenase family protein [Catenuloplanes sp. NPDC051500]|uniref:acyl-CoA dehydrogenase family protein n=1 Tax=Catenuloplanes sp. NPDC051500 TaxID=3363959 RepID=UPI0037B52D6B